MLRAADNLWNRSGLTNVPFPYNVRGKPKREGATVSDLRFAVRLLLKQPGFSVINALTVALGIGATSAIFTLIQGVLLTTPPFRNCEQLVVLEPASTVGSILTLVGIYGLLSLSVASRGRELAIRSAVGAQLHHIRNLTFGEGFRLIAGGVLIGIAVAILLSRALRSFLYDVQPGDPLTLIVVGALFISVGLLACWVPVRRAAKVDPLEALRYE